RLRRDHVLHRGVGAGSGLRLAQGSHQMDLVPTSGTPLPPAPISTNTNGATNAGLVAALGAVHDSAGQTIPTRVLPGGIPALQVPPADLLDVATHLRDDLGFDLLSCVSGVDMVEYRQVVYHLRATGRNWLLEMKVDVPTDSNMVDSLISVWPTANWLERET